MNLLIFLNYILVSVSITCIVVKLGERWTVSWLSVLVVLSNFFSLKQITLINLKITAVDPIIISLILGLNLSREFFSEKTTKEITDIMSTVAIIFLIITRCHMLFTPSIEDASHSHFQIILSASTRAVFSSLFLFYVLQKLNNFIFYFLKKLLKNSSFFIRSTICLIIIQFLYSFCFSYLAFYKILNNICHISLVNFLIKLPLILALSPITYFMNKILKFNKSHSE